ncbi:MAG: hypothetical protein WCY19_08220 [Candidatus Gastranaerophilaceae bacterium]
MKIEKTIYLKNQIKFGKCEIKDRENWPNGEFAQKYEGSENRNILKTFEESELYKELHKSRNKFIVSIDGTKPWQWLSPPHGSVTFELSIIPAKFKNNKKFMPFKIQDYTDYPFIEYRFCETIKNTKFNKVMEYFNLECKNLGKNIEKELKADILAKKLYKAVDQFTSGLPFK